MRLGRNHITYDDRPGFEQGIKFLSKILILDTVQFDVEMFSRKSWRQVLKVMVQLETGVPCGL